MIQELDRLLGREQVDEKWRDALCSPQMTYVLDCLQFGIRACVYIRFLDSLCAWFQLVESIKAELLCCCIRVDGRQIALWGRTRF